MKKDAWYYIEIYKKTFDVSFPRCYLQNSDEKLIEIIKKCLAEGHPLDFDQDPMANY